MPISGKGPVRRPFDPDPVHHVQKLREGLQRLKHAGPAQHAARKEADRLELKAQLTQSKLLLPDLQDEVHATRLQQAIQELESDPLLGGGQMPSSHQVLEPTELSPTPAPTPTPPALPAVEQPQAQPAPAPEPAPVEQPEPLPAPASPAQAPVAPGPNQGLEPGTRLYSDANDPNHKTYGASGATWLTGHGGDVAQISRVLEDARRQGSVPTFVQYGIPGRDGGGPSAGGAGSMENYRQQLESYAKAIGNAEANVIIEPDALPLGLSPEGVKMAVETYEKFAPNAKLFIDAGHSDWRSAEETADLLIRAGIDKADGFSLNTSGFEWTSESMAFGDEVLAALKARNPALADKQYVVDTSRNGNGPGVDESGNKTWGDPVRAVNGGPIMTGPKPTTDTDNPNCAAFLWVKPPGVGDNRTRSAGEFGGEAWVKHDPNPRLGPA